MKALRAYIRENHEELRLSTGGFALELHTPWRQSRTGRCQYLVRDEGRSEYRVVIQEGLSLHGVTCTQNPYEPSFHQKVESLLPRSRGSFNLGGVPYYWAEFVDQTSLQIVLESKRGRHARDNRRRELVNAVSRIGDLQTKDATRSTDYVAGLDRVCSELIGDRVLFSYYRSVTQPIREHLENQPPLPCSWSHGDLWPRDVLVGGDTLRVLDWEWAFPIAPIGADLLDLYVTSVGLVFGFSFTEVLSGLQGKGGARMPAVVAEISRACNSLGFEPKMRRGVVLFCLMRSVGRVLAQDGANRIALIEEYCKVAARFLDRNAPEPVF